jgi:hypothetical protein
MSDMEEPQEPHFPQLQSKKSKRPSLTSTKSDHKSPSEGGKWKSKGGKNAGKKERAGAKEPAAGPSSDFADWNCTELDDSMTVPTNAGSGGPQHQEYGRDSEIRSYYREDLPPIYVAVG